MRVHRKGFDDAIKLQLHFSAQSTEDLQALLGRRDPANTRRYVHDKKTRNAIAAVLRVRGRLATRRA